MKTHVKKEKKKYPYHRKKNPSESFKSQNKPILEKK